MQIPGISRCTAVLIGPRVVLTAAHCLYGARLGHFVPAGSVHVLTGYDKGAFAAHTVATDYAVGAGFDPLRARETGGADIAVVHLSTPLGDDGAPGVWDTAPRGGLPLALAGFSQDRAEVLLVDADCESLSVTLDDGGRPLLVHDCAGTRGTSGGPLLGRDADGSWRVVGIQHAAFAGRGGLAVPATAATMVARAAPPETAAPTNR